MAGMMIPTSARNSATDMPEHTHRKVILAHTLPCQLWKELNGFHANIGSRIAQTFHYGRKDDPNIPPKFGYKHCQTTLSTLNEVMLKHTPFCQLWEELHGYQANIRIFQTFCNGTNDHPNVIPEFNCKHAWARQAGSDANSYPALPALKGDRWLHCGPYNQNLSDVPKWYEWSSECPPEVQLQTCLSTPIGKWC